MLIVVDGEPLSVTLPSDLKAGNYLFRNEIIALHTATSEGGVEFYPACAQLSVGGTQNGTPNATVSIPGVYDGNEPGIKLNIYSRESRCLKLGASLTTASISHPGQLHPAGPRCLERLKACTEPTEVEFLFLP